jgi:hypothetical protein
MFVLLITIIYRSMYTTTTVAPITARNHHACWLTGMDGHPSKGFYCVRNCGEGRSPRKRLSQETDEIRRVTRQVSGMRMPENLSLTSTTIIKNFANPSPTKCPQLGPRKPPHVVGIAASHHPLLLQLHQHANVQRHRLPRTRWPKRPKWMTKWLKIRR